MFLNDVSNKALQMMLPNHFPSTSQTFLDNFFICIFLSSVLGIIGVFVVFVYIKHFCFIVLISSSSFVIPLASRGEEQVA